MYFLFLIFIGGPPALAGRVLWNRVCPSFRPSVCPGVFLEWYHKFFSKFWHDARNPYEVVRDRAGFSRRNFFAPKIGKMGQKQGFFNILKNYVINFYWICSMMKIYNICCVPTQISYLGKFLFPKYGPKCFQPIRLQDFLINHISRTNQWNSLIFCMLIQIYIN